MQLEFTSNFEGIFGLRTPRAPFWAPFMYAEMRTWVFFFNSKLENEVSNDIQSCRSKKHEIFKFLR